MSMLPVVLVVDIRHSFSSRFGFTYSSMSGTHEALFREIANMTPEESINTHSPIAK